MSRNGGDVVVETLTALGVSHVFGIPGQHALGLFDAIRRSELQFVSSRVENNSAFGADGYARATGEVGVLFLSTGPGALTALGALQEAYSTAAAVYCLLYGVAGALIGMAESTFLPDGGPDASKDDVYARIAEAILPVGISGIVVIIAALLNDVVAALTIAYDILVGGLLVAILGGFLWKRATGVGALWSIAAGTVVTLGTMVVVGDVLANEPIYYGLGASLVVYVVVSLLTPATAPEVLRVWEDRLAGRDEQSGSSTAVPAVPTES